METEIVKANRKAIARAVSVLRKGGMVIYPTETQYGIGADATSRKAVAKVFAIKKRPRDKKLIIAFSSLEMAKRYLQLDRDAIQLAKKFMPGPLSLVVNNKHLPLQGDVAFRIPKHPLALAIIRKFAKPITTTSANISGKKPGGIKEIIKTFNGVVDLIIDAGNLPPRKPSTVFDVQARKVLRKGPISEKQIKAVLK